MAASAAAVPWLLRRIPLNDGKSIPAIGLGVFRTSGSETYSSVLNALQLGYRHIDTAAFYGNEADVGRAVRDSKVPRNEVFVTTKIWLDDAGFDATLKAGRQAKQRLNIEYIDLLLLHAPFPERLASYKALEQLQQDGITKSIGVSNFSEKHLTELLKSCKVTPAVNQVELHPFLQRPELVAFCQKHNILMEGYSPLAKAARMTHPALVAVAEAVGATPAQVMLRWALDRGFVVLPKSSKAERQMENASVDSVVLGPHAATLAAMEEGLITGWNPLVWP